MSSQNLSVLLVSDDRSMLRHTSRLLTAFGYDVRVAADCSVAMTGMKTARPDFLILDETMIPAGGLELFHFFVERDSPSTTCTILLAERAGRVRITEAIEAGADDILSKPLVHGELLARLRAGARLIERQRRAAARSQRDPLTQLLNRGALASRFDEELGWPTAPSCGGACIALDLDFFRHVNIAHGRPHGDEVLQQVAERLTNLADPNMPLARLNGNLFAALVPSETDEDAVRLAESWRSAIAETEFFCGDDLVQLTASFGVAEIDSEADGIDDVLRRAEQAVLAAKNSGRDCVIRAGQFDHETHAWNELAEPGRMFERTRARHVMSPCTLLLRGDQPMGQVASMLCRGGAPAFPVVDKAGKLIGSVRQQNMTDAGRQSRGSVKRSTATLRDWMECPVDHVDEQTTFDELLSLLAISSSQLLFVVRDGRPTGFVTPGSLAALSETVHRDTFRRQQPLTRDVLCLQVPDTCYDGE